MLSLLDDSFPAVGDDRNTTDEATWPSDEAASGPVEVVELHSLRRIYRYSCAQHHVRARDDVLRQLPPVVGVDWASKVQVLDLSLAYVGRGGCAALVPVVGLCGAMTHLLMPSIGLTEEEARPLLYVLQAHPSVTWVDLSGNHLNDNVGRWILTMVLENRNICFVQLRDTGISPPLVLKIERHLKRAGGELVDSRISPLRASNTEEVQLSGPTCLRSRFSSVAARGRRLPAFVADGLAELRHVLYSNCHSLQYVYDCFIPPLFEAGEETNDGKAFHAARNKMSGARSVLSIPTTYTGQCSWRLFFRGLRLLGIHTVSHSLTESVTFATICGICNLETICFGKLLDFLRPHVAVKAAPSEGTCGLDVSPRTTCDTRDVSSFASGLFDCGGVSTSDGPPAVCVASSLSSLVYPLSEKVAEERPSSDSSHSAGCVSADHVDTADTLLVLKPNRSFPMGTARMALRVPLECPAAAATFRPPSRESAAEAAARALEAQFVIDCFFADRKMQRVVDRLYDARAALRESLQPTDTSDGKWAELAPLDELVERAVSVVGEAGRGAVVALLRPWAVGAGSRPMVRAGAWLGSMHVPGARVPAIPPLPLSEERRMWRCVDLETFQSALNA